MKKYITGFAPVPFKLVGTILLLLGLGCLLAKVFVYVTKIVPLSNSILFFGVTFVAIGLYLIFVVPDEYEQDE